MFSTPSLNFYRKDDKTTSKEKKTQTKKKLQKQTNKTKEMETKLHKTQK